MSAPACPGNRGPQMVVTDLGIMKFDEETKRMYLAYYYPFSTPEMVQENTGFEIDLSRAQLMEGPLSRHHQAHPRGN